MTAGTKQWLRLCMLLMAVLPALPAQAGAVVVVVGSNSGLASMTRQQVSAIYLGRTQRLPNGKQVYPLESSNEAVRDEFYQRLTGKPTALVDAYWARLYFAGQQSPPRRMSSDEAVIEQVKRQPGSIGFINRSSLTRDSALNVVLELE